MTHLLNETRFPLTELASEQGVSPATPYRWANRGVNGVRLEIYVLGGRHYTTREAFDRFVGATTEAVVAR